ncbi:DUF2155 domain-containing protein [Brevundimonas lutea]|uniref:DUF2155 domain-containing protein n=1 Tax=Brevundimonas lutea TaxID=2293980 RepID=UPI000F02F395|nr:DUF2155 domain-containing protein [Brevundimonas lutea]
MRRRGSRLLVVGVAMAALAGGGVVMAQQAEAPPADPIGELLKEAPPQEPAPAAADPAPVTTESLNAAPPAAVQPPAPAIEVAEVETEEAEVEPEDEDEPAEVAVAEKAEETAPPGRRQRRPVAIVRAIDKISAETMTFAVQVGGPPVRFRNTLLFTARACEVSAPDEPIADSVAYLEISTQPRTARRRTEPRQVFRGWMFASSPSVNPLEHPIYDAWVVGCRSA